MTELVHPSPYSLCIAYNSLLKSSFPEPSLSVLMHSNYILGICSVSQDFFNCTFGILFVCVCVCDFYIALFFGFFNIFFLQMLQIFKKVHEKESHFLYVWQCFFNLTFCLYFDKCKFIGSWNGSLRTLKPWLDWPSVFFFINDEIYLIKS